METLWDDSEDSKRNPVIHACAGEYCQVCGGQSRHGSRQMSLLPDEIEVRFVKFHQDNPQVYDALVDMAREWKQSGNDKCSMKMLFEILRWQYGIRTNTSEPFALSNDFTSRYARLIAANESDLSELFYFRNLHQ
jgi:hypothetical protein